MDEILGKSPSVSPPVVVGSLPTSMSQVRVRVEEDEEVRGAGVETGAAGEQPGGGAAGAGAGEAAGAVVAVGAQRRREREDPFLVLVREDILYQRQADERREAAARERSERFFSLLEQLVERRK